MKLDVSTSHQITIITVCESRMDASVAPEFRKRVIELCMTPGVELILDMNQVTFIDSSALGALVGCYKAVISCNGSFALCGVSGAVLELLKLTRLESVFPCYPSIDDAQSFLRAA